MAIRIQTTHIWTKVFIPINLISRILAICIVISILEMILPDNGFATFVYIIAFLGTLILHGIFIEQWYHQLQTWLYIRINLDTKISLSEAKTFMLLFAPTELGTWYPMTGIKELPKDYRREALYQSAYKIYSELGYAFPSENFNNVHSPNIDNENETALPPDFYCLVGLLCKLAKRDGVISKEELDVIDYFFLNTLKLTSNEREDAIKFFKKSKDTDIPFEVYAREFYKINRDNKEILESIVILLADVACADGDLSSEEEILIYEVISIFDVDETIYEDYKLNYSKVLPVVKTKKVFL